jgi:hypothetical protein
MGICGMANPSEGFVDDCLRFVAEFDDQVQSGNLADCLSVLVHGRDGVSTNYVGGYVMTLFAYQPSKLTFENAACRLYHSNHSSFGVAPDTSGEMSEATF